MLGLSCSFLLYQCITYLATSNLSDPVLYSQCIEHCDYYHQFYYHKNLYSSYQIFYGKLLLFEHSSHCCFCFNSTFEILAPCQYLIQVNCLSLWNFRQLLYFWTYTFLTYLIIINLFQKSITFNLFWKYARITLTGWMWARYNICLGIEADCFNYFRDVEICKSTQIAHSSREFQRNFPGNAGNLK